MFLLEQNCRSEHAPNPAQSVEDTLSSLQGNYAEPVTVRQPAEMARLPQWQYTALFRELTGKKPLDYVTELRINRSKQLLIASQDPLREIARQVGFSDEYYFNRRFRQTTGVTPRQYARSMRSRTRVRDWTGHEVEIPARPERIFYYGETLGDLLALGADAIGGQMNPFPEFGSEFVALEVCNMRGLELAVIAANLLAAAWICFGRKDKRRDASALSVLAAACLLHAGIGPLRLQMLPAYILALILGLMLLTRLIRGGGRHRPARITIAALSLLVLALSGASAYLTYLFPVFALPEPTGSYAIGTASYHLADPSREETYTDEKGDNRELMITVWYPADPDAAAKLPRTPYPKEVAEAMSLVFGFPPSLFGYLDAIPAHTVEGAAVSDAQPKYPVLLFSPGIRSTRYQSMTIVEELASNGYIVVGIDHPYTSSKVNFPAGRSVLYRPDPEYPASAAQYEANVTGTDIRSDDARFVLDTLAGWNTGTGDADHLLRGKIDLDRAGIFGHSYGGAKTAETLAKDSRFKAGVSLEGGFWGNVAHTGLKQPFMYMLTSDTADMIREQLEGKQSAEDGGIGQGTREKLFYEEYIPDLQSVFEKSAADRYYLTVKGFFHQRFADAALLSPLFAKEVSADQSVRINRDYVRSFFDRYLLGKEAPLLDGPAPPYPEVEFDPKLTVTGAAAAPSRQE
ncbi:helix-turn-helix domain-containing protein [Paenibacillus melissococcoides]|nr:MULTISPECIES: helix-turn-helix domain-containing protein [Paenibacillus]MEB9897444.1 helix-turn-helix domain-containing protein [Bacillus cereus]GIO77632.1 hypothetical protein J6TS7_12420 [Paenibacillus dendritiformis]CAH8703467.1 helix-turn-helix domain-containing protein [Paenibacillus melissococcoides]CAH8705882.1 helix-turn-helix domain-containing protein [Paenibacillus melissococcoides]